MFDAVRAGDAALGLVDVPVPDDLRAHPVADHEVVLVSPSSEDLPDPLPLDALDGIRLALPTRGSGRRCEMEAMFAALWVRPVPAVESDDRVHWIASVLNGEGSMLWYRTIAEAVFGDAAVVRSFSPPLVRSVALVHAAAEPSGAARTFLEYARLVGIVDDP